MAIMITGASIMDGAMLMVAANETCPQPQTREHLMALEISGIEKIWWFKNKIDSVSKERALESYQEKSIILRGSIAENAPIIPVSAHHDVNLINVHAIESIIETPERDPSAKAVMHVARSFDINRPGLRPSSLKGGVIGGSIVQGQFNIGDKIEIGPGRKIGEGKKVRYEPISSVITSMQGGLNLDTMQAGGLCGMATPLDPSFTTSDNLSGQVLAKEGQLPDIRDTISIQVNLMENMVTSDGDGPEPVMPLRNNEMLMVNVATSTSVGVVSKSQSGKANLQFAVTNLC